MLTLFVSQSQAGEPITTRASFARFLFSFGLGRIIVLVALRFFLYFEAFTGKFSSLHGHFDFRLALFLLPFGAKFF